MGKKQSKRPKKPAQEKAKKTKIIADSDEVSPAKVMEIVRSVGMRERCQQVRVKVLSGRDAGKVIRRNVLGPVKIGDTLILRETEIEASPTKGRKK